MTEQHDDLLHFLERRFGDIQDTDEPEREMRDALLAWVERGCPPPSLSVRYTVGGAIKGPRVHSLHTNSFRTPERGTGS